MSRLVEKSVPVIAIPTDIPTCLWVAVSAEAVPRRSCATEPMMMLLLEGWKLPTPVPRTMSTGTRCCERGLKVEGEQEAIGDSDETGPDDREP